MANMEPTRMGTRPLKSVDLAKRNLEHLNAPSHSQTAGVQRRSRYAHLSISDANGIASLSWLELKSQSLPKSIKLTPSSQHLYSIMKPISLISYQQSITHYSSTLVGETVPDFTAVSIVLASETDIFKSIEGNNLPVREAKFRLSSLLSLATTMASSLGLDFDDKTDHTYRPTDDDEEGEGEEELDEADEDPSNAETAAALPSKTSVKLGKRKAVSGAETRATSTAQAKKNKIDTQATLSQWAGIASRTSPFPVSSGASSSSLSSTGPVVVDSNEKLAVSRSSSSNSFVIKSEESLEEKMPQPKTRADLRRLGYLETLTPNDGKPLAEGARYFSCHHCRFSTRITKKSNGDTKPLYNHLKDHPKILKLVDQSIQVIEKKDINVPIAESVLRTISGRSQSLPSGTLEAMFADLRSKDWSIQRYETAIVELFAGHNLSFSLIEAPLWRAFVAVVASAGQNRVPDVNRKQLQGLIVKSAEEHKQLLSEILQDHDGKLHFTIDGWTSDGAQHPFFTIIVHYTSPSFRLQQHLVDFVPLEGSHTGDRIGDLLFSTFESYGILEKVGQVVSDSASNMTKAAQRISTRFADIGITWDAKQQRLHCHAHTLHNTALKLLQLIDTSITADELEKRLTTSLGLREAVIEAADVSDAVKNNNIEANVDNEDPILDDEDGWFPGENPADYRSDDLRLLLGKVRTIVRYVRSSPRRRHEFRVLEVRCGDADTELLAVLVVLDMRIRWGSTFVMLVRFLRLEKTVRTWINQNDDLKLYALSELDFSVLRMLVDWLSVFARAVTQLSTASEPSLPLVSLTYSHILKKLASFLTELPDSAPKEFRNGLLQCHQYLAGKNDLKDQSVFNIWATIFDPRVRRSHWRKEEFERDDAVIAALEFLPQYLEVNYPISDLPSSQSTPVPSTSASTSLFSSDDDYDIFASVGIATASGVTSAAQELDTYDSDLVTCPVDHKTTRPGEWWNTIGKIRFPRLARMARDILSIPASAVATERVHSQAKDTITLRRQSLHASTIRQVIFLKHSVLEKTKE